MSWRIVRAIAAKDWREVRQNRMAWMPMLVLPLIFCVFIPLLFTILPQVIPADQMMGATDLEILTRSAPSFLKDQLASLNESQTMVLLLLGYLLAPMFLILPIMTSSVIGAESFVGEKERKTMEALLYTPASEHELFFGKMLAAIIPSILLTWGSFIVYTLILNISGGRIMERVWFPTPPWWPLILWVTPAVAVAGNVATVLISSRVSTFMEAYQASGTLVLPVILLVIGQVAGVLFLGVEVVIVVGVVIWAIDIGLLWFALKIFSRARLMGTAGQNQG